jgi:hypothetical protein
MYWLGCPRLLFACVLLLEGLDAAEDLHDLARDLRLPGAVVSAG